MEAMVGNGIQGSEWLRRVGRRLLGSNPFYLLSAALILLGVSLAMRDYAFMSEAEQVGFNLLALLSYETLLVGTALVLARRGNDYDSTLLVVLEQVFVFVPFILLSLAVFENTALRVGPALGIVLYAGVRFGLLKRLYGRLNLPWLLLVLGVPVLVLSLTLPLGFHWLHSWGGVAGEAPAAIHKWLWLAVLPVLAALGNVLARPRIWPESPPQRAWLPVLIWTIWMGALAAHVGWIRFVYELEFLPVWLLPLAWVAAWSVHNRWGDFGVARPEWLARLTRVLPSAAALGALAPGLEVVALAMNAGNTLIYALLWRRRPHDRMLPWLVLVGAVGMIATLPQRVLPAAVPVDGQGDMLALALGLAVLLLAVLLRHPVAGLLGSAALALGLREVLPAGLATHLPIQLAAAALLLHSLGWDAAYLRDTGARVVRGGAALLWLGHSFAWGLDQTGTYQWTTGLLAAALLAVVWGLRRLDDRERPRSATVAAVGVIMLIPGQVAYEVISKGGIGIALMAASLALFAVGTLVAWKREGWDRPEPTAPGGAGGAGGSGGGDASASPTEPDAPTDAPSPAVPPPFVPERPLPPQRHAFTLKELVAVIVLSLTVLAVLAAMMLPVFSKARERPHGRNCAGNLKQIGLALLMYSGDNGGFFPVESEPGATDFEPLNVQDVLDDGKVYACPSAAQSLTLARNSNYRYRGSGLKDDNDSAREITIAYDRSGNHPDNGWMNALFIDGHAEGAKPDGNKQPNGWNLND